MNYKQMTAPCGRDCFNCPFYLATKNDKYKKIIAQKYEIKHEDVPCNGCKNIEGQCNFLKSIGFSTQCKIYKCSSEKNVDFCYECNEFPCDLLHPLADQADKLPHNLKIFSLCQIKKMGLETWAQNKAKESFEKYYKDKLDL